MAGATSRDETLTVEESERALEVLTAHKEWLEKELYEFVRRGPEDWTSKDFASMGKIKSKIEKTEGDLKEIHRNLEEANRQKGRREPDNSSTITRQSTALRKLEFERKKKLTLLQRERDKQVKVMNLKIDQLNKKIQREDGDVPAMEVQRSDLMEEIALINTEYDEKLKEAEEDFQFDCEEIEIEEEGKSEQVLDANEEKIVRDWKPPRSPSPIEKGQQQQSAMPKVNDSVQFVPDAHSQKVTPPIIPVSSNFPQSWNMMPQQQSVSDKDGMMLALMNKMLQRDETRLPDFDGNPAKWSGFKNAFERTKDQLHTGKDMRRLQFALKGQAKKAVEHLFAHDGNVPYIISILERRFGRPEMILNHLVDEAKKAKPITRDKPHSLVEFGTLVESIVCNILSYGKHEYMHNPFLVDELVKKLPIELKDDWHKQLLTSGIQATMQNFSSWLSLHVNIATLSLTAKDFKPEEKVKEKGDKKTRCSIQAAAEEKRKFACYICDGPHTAYKCEVFKKMSIEDRWKAVKDKKLCFKCFSPHHRTGECERPVCGKDKCANEHHSLLHQTGKGKINSKNTKKPSKPDEEDDDDDFEEKDKELLKRLTKLRANDDKKEKEDSEEKKEGFCGVVVSSASLPIIPVTVSGPAGECNIMALLDSGATCTMIEDCVASQIGLKGKKSPFNFTVFGEDQVIEKDSRVVSARIKGSFKNAKTYNLEGIRTIYKLGIPGHTVNVEELKENHPHLHQLNMKPLRAEKPQMVIGCNQFSLFRPREALEAGNKKPSAYKSLLGWYVIQNQQQRNSCQVLVESLDDRMHQEMKDFFSTESFGVKPMVQSARSSQDARAEKLIKENTVKIGNRWQTCLLWKSDDINLPESKTMALNRLRTMERKMDRDPEFAKMVTDKFEEYIAEGFLEESKLEAREESNSRRWFLPWFFAFHESKKSRLVFDGAAKSHGKCFNDFMLKGPDVIQPLPAVLTRFRTHPVAVCADIQAMFHQVKVDSKDRPAQTVLYRGTDRSQPPKAYEMTVLYFGSASSPSSAISTKNLNAERFKAQFPKAVEATEFETYVDDQLTGGETENEAIQLYQDLRLIHEDGGFPLLKWTSNSRAVLEAIPSEIRAHGEISFNDKEDIPSEKTLGLLWNPVTDEFAFNFSLSKIPKDVLEGKRHPTKRQMSSIVMSLFDPLGFVCPLKVKGIIILQNIWRSCIGWDDEVGPDINQQWLDWFQELKTVTEVRVPRRLSPVKLEEVINVQLHIFCDASSDAFAAVAYLRIETQNKEIFVRVVAGKVRVAPLRGLTIPRMELQAAVMGSRLRASIIDWLRGKITISEFYMWTDSKTVLCWIRNSEQRYNPFIQNRVGEILELTNVADWRWVPTKENVADDATRLSAPFVPVPNRWVEGSAFLQQEKEAWPVEKFNLKNEVHEQDLEAKEAIHAMKETEESSSNLPLPDISKYSSWWKLLRATAMKFVAARRFLKRQPYRLTNKDMKRARMEWIKHSQKESFPDEVNLLMKAKSLPNSSRLAPLCPAMRKGIIVLGSRIEKAKLQEATRHPPILDPNGTYTRLMVQWYHDTSHHFGQERVVNELQKTVWILFASAAVRRCKFNCLICKKNSAKPVPPKMGQLPKPRIEMGKLPFHKTGVDYFGPLFIRTGRKTRRTEGTDKRYGVLFTCLATRAVHLELAESLETEEFLKVLTRFVNRRGEPAEIWSDNGTNFVGAEREMKEYLQKWKKDDVTNAMLRRGIDWHFIGPASPHMGGSWESLVKQTKQILYRILKERNPKENDLVTLLTEVQAILNSRPLTKASPDASDASCLTPNHLLNLPCVIGPSIAAENNYKDLQKSWRLAQKLARDFWKRWSVEYLPWLAKRRKWTSEAKPLAVGDIVVMLEDNAIRNDWKMGRITAVFPGKDGQVRTVEVLITRVDPDDPKKIVKSSYLRRPAVKICPLNIN